MSTPTDLGSERPFPGLRPYASVDALWFCGRELQTSALYSLVERNRFTAVVGSSGSGKSSLVRAGLLPVLRTETEDSGGKCWSCFEMRPGEAPMEGLAAALAGSVPAAETDPDGHAISVGLRDSLEFALRRSSFGIRDALRELRLPFTHTVLLLIDQFEEVFRFADLGRADVDRAADARARHEAAAFVELLIQASRQSECALHVVLTMRSDYLGECARFQGLPQAVTQSQFLVPAMTRDEREQAIREPIRRANATVDDHLVERVLNDGTDELDQLPVLQHALMRTWEHARARCDWGRLRTGESRKLFVSDYEAIGGLSDALTRHADEVLVDLAGAETAVEQTFRALAELDREGRAIRRARRFVTLYAETGCREDDLRTVIDRFRQLDCSFLVPPPPTPIENDTVVDIGHEALIRRWKRMTAAPEAALAGGTSECRKRAGWLWAETADGNTYRSLLELIHGAPDDVQPTLPADQVTKRTRWWEERPRTTAWAARYGGEIEAVQKLFADSKAKLASVERKRIVTRCSLIGALVVSIGFGGFAAWQWRYAAEQVKEVEAGSFWRRLQLFPDMRSEDVDTLWELAAAPEDVRLRFVRQLTEEPQLMRQFGMNPQPIARAIGLAWPDAATELVLHRIQVASMEIPDISDAGGWQTLGVARAMIALSDRLDPRTQDRARGYVDAALRAAAERAISDPSKLWMVAQLADQARTFVDPATIRFAREKIAITVDNALSSPRGEMPTGLAIGIALAASLPPYSPSRSWAAFDYLIDFVTKPNSGFGSARVARQIGPLIARLKPIGRARMRGRELTDPAEALLGAIATVTTEAADPNYPLVLVDAVNALAAKLQTADAAAIDERIARVLRAYPEPFKRAALASAASSIAARLGATNLPESSPLLAEIAIGGRNDGNASEYTAVLWAVRGGRDRPAPKMAGLGDLLLTLAPGEHGYRAAALARLLAIGAANLGPSDASELANSAMRALLRAPDAFSREGLAILLAALAPRIDGMQRRAILDAVEAKLGEATSPEEAVALVRVAGDLLPPTGPELLAAATEILKYPTVAGAPTTALLEIVETRLGRAVHPPTNSLGDMPVPILVQWLQQQEGMDRVLRATAQRPRIADSPRQVARASEVQD